jgi:hypothetical protein
MKRRTHPPSNARQPCVDPHMLWHPILNAPFSCIPWHMLRAPIAATLVAGCAPDDWDGTDYVPDTSVDTTDTSDTGDTSSPDGFVGDWRSQGNDLSALFAADPFNYAVVDASFRSNGSYTVDATDDEGADYALVGTYTVDESTDPAAIALHQSEPYEALASGIYRVVGDTLTYEIVQTSPDYGFVPPTPSTGFGSTSGPNMDDGINVQTYRRR